MTTRKDGRHMGIEEGEWEIDFDRLKERAFTVEERDGLEVAATAYAKHNRGQRVKAGAIFTDGFAAGMDFSRAARVPSPDARAESERLRQALRLIEAWTQDNMRTGSAFVESINAHARAALSEGEGRDDEGRQARDCLAQEQNPRETCPVCGQPDNCGDCDHTPLAAEFDEVETVEEAQKSLAYAIRMDEIEQTWGSVAAVADCRARLKAAERKAKAYEPPTITDLDADEGARRFGA